MHSFTNVTRSCMPAASLRDYRLSDFDDACYGDNLDSRFITPRQGTSSDGLSHEHSEPEPRQTRTAGAVNGVGCTPMSEFAMLDGQMKAFRPDAGSVVLSTRSDEDAKARRASTAAIASSWALAGFRAIAAIIASCFLFHILALLVFCSSSYQNSIQPWIISGMESYIKPYQSREDVAGFVYLICCGVIPTVVASTLWQSFKGNKLLYVASQSEKLSRFLRRKPTFTQCFSSPPKQSQIPGDDDSSSTTSEPKSLLLYIDATWGEIAFVVLMLISDTFLFIQVLVVEGVSSLSSSYTVLRAMGKSFGYMSLFTMVWLLVPVDKSSFWMEFFHLPYPLGIKYRRWLGGLTLLFGVAHCVCYAMSFYLRDEFISQMLPHFGAMYQDTPMRDANGVNAFGEVALAAMIIVAMASLRVFRRKFYAMSLSVQQIMGSIALIAVCVHFPQALWWLFPSLVVFVTQKIVAGSHARYPIEIVDMAPLPNGTTRLVCRRTTRQKDSHRAFTPGQFVYLYASRISWFQWHPFYIASSPSAHDDTFKVYVQASGDWTETFFDLSKLAYATQEAPVIFADGFYGPSLPIYYEQYGCLVLVAEGIGATGVIAMLEELFFKAKTRREVRSISGVNENGAGEEEETRQVWFMWVCKDICLFKEFEELLMDIQAFDPSENHFKIRLFLTKMPTIQEIKYNPPMPCIFEIADDPSVVKKDASKSTKEKKKPSSDGCNHHREHHSIDIVNTRESSTTPPPQNRSSCCRFKSRPFQESVASPVYKVIVLLVVFAATLALAIHIERQDHQHGSGVFGGEATETEGMFRPLHRIACVLVILMGCFSAYAIIIWEEVAKMIANLRRRGFRSNRNNSALRWRQRSRRRTCGTECEPVSVCATTTSMTTEAISNSSTTSSTTHWIEMSPHGHRDLGQDHTSRLRSEDCESPRGEDQSSLYSSAGGLSIITEEENNRSALDLLNSSAVSAQEPDILEKLNILSLRPDLDRFMATVAKGYFAYSAEPIGVFACGNPKFVSTSEAAVLAAGEHDSKATYRFHRMDFRV
ncbi:Sarcosine oxidase [Globisporangium polare]